MADLDKELGFWSSQLTEKSEAAKIEEDEDIMKILSSARSRYTKVMSKQYRIDSFDKLNIDYYIFDIQLSSRW